MRARRHAFVAIMAAFCLGALSDWWLRDEVAPHVHWRTQQAVRSEPAGSDVALPANRAVATSGVEPADPVAALHEHDLRVPIDGVDPATFKGQFSETREGTRSHEAVDILAPRNTPVHAVEDGSIAKLFVSKAGGLTIYQFDPSGRFCYYYAHLERYADGLADGQAVSRGEVIGYVGTSGNAPPNTPHLHFAVNEMTADHRWWHGRPLDPYLVFTH